MAENVFARSALDHRIYEVVLDDFAFTCSATRGRITASPDLWISPAFIDLQVNGFAGVDYNSPGASIDEIDRSLGVIRRTGVASLLPTVITGDADHMIAALRNLRQAQQRASLGRMIAGFHVEGPHISPEDGPRGAHPLQHVRLPDFNEFLKWQDATEGNIRVVTLSPHWEESPRYIENVVAAGASVSIGHTHASAAQIAEAVSAGASMSTHLGNAAHPMLPKTSNYIWDQLADDRLTASFIADGIHIPAGFLRSALRAKTIDRSVLVTDASSPAGALPGRYKLGEQDVDLTVDGRVVMAGQNRLAGSALKLNEAVARVMREAGLSLEEVLQLATANPARAACLEIPKEQILFRLTSGRLDVLAMSA
jgi:N-acetylglucosamine-6-phosphate deacetylase